MTNQLTIREKIEAALAKDGMLRDVQIKGGNYPNERIIRRNVFCIEFVNDPKPIPNRVWIEGEFWARDYTTEKPVTQRVYCFCDEDAEIIDLCFELISGFIPLDFYSEYAGAKGVV